MPRANRRRVEPEPESPALRTTVGERHETWRGDDYVVRAVTAAGASKVYRCPGCDQEIRRGVPHVVVWPEHHDDADERRHWHTACWAARDRRGPAVQRTRNAPRY
ncbi:MAG TPA: hypothetical protein VJ831_12690 [Jatrophihabitantaceae bacterium]|nr:hypothetical protein [Jatrophihabitantaceae bacterium]